VSDDQLSTREVAALAGIEAPTLRAYVTRGQAPKPDGRVGGSNWWWRSTIEQWLDNRPGPGWRHGISDLNSREH
jgi:predicted DNA-binding transcriptional regulator AlpA